MVGFTDRYVEIRAARVWTANFAQSGRWRNCVVCKTPSQIVDKESTCYTCQAVA